MLPSARELAAGLSSRPFRWGLYRDFVTPGLARALAADFPDDGFFLSAPPGSGKCFQFRDLYSDGAVRGGDALAASWKEVLTKLASDEYRHSVAAACDVPLDGTSVSIGAAVYENGYYLRPHTDRAFRLITQVIYLNPLWLGQWGGRLLLLNSSDEDDIAATVSPLLGHSVIFIRSVHSWHAVERVRNGVPVSRRSILLHFSQPTVGPG
jgi:SM-20-related protein